MRSVMCRHVGLDGHCMRPLDERHRLQGDAELLPQIGDVPEVVRHGDVLRLAGDLHHEGDPDEVRGNQFYRPDTLHSKLWGIPQVAILHEPQEPLPPRRKCLRPFQNLRFRPKFQYGRIVNWSLSRRNCFAEYVYNRIHVFLSATYILRCTMGTAS